MIKHTPTMLSNLLKSTGMVIAVHLQQNHDDITVVIRQLENQVIETMMRLCQGNQSEASRKLGMSRTKLIYRLKQLPSRDIGQEVLEGIEELRDRKND